MTAIDGVVVIVEPIVMFPVSLMNSIFEDLKFSLPDTLLVVRAMVVETVIELFAVTLNLLSVPDKALVEFTEDWKTTVPALAPTPVEAVMIFTYAYVLIAVPRSVALMFADVVPFGVKMRGSLIVPAPDQTPPDVTDELIVIFTCPDQK